MGRPRAMRNGHIYTPRDSQAAIDRMRELLGAAIGAGFEPLEGFLRVGFRFTRTRGRGGRFGDGDNYEKLAMDACTGLLWRDDAQVRACSWELIVGDAGAVQISVEPLESAPNP
jgi:hypothetical protein